MTAKATITFTQPGVQPPVFVVTSLSEPPWQIFELDVRDSKDESEDKVFFRDFGNAAEGTYQYKIRIGHDHWVIDESTDTATDDSGNRNNVLHVKPQLETGSTASTTDVSAPDQKQDSHQDIDDSQQHESRNNNITEKDSVEPPSVAKHDEAAKTGQSEPGLVPDVPVPFVVVEKVSDEPRPQYGDVEADSLHENQSNRAADADPDFESVSPPVSTDAAPTEPSLPTVPTVIVEKTDHVPSFGDDFGEHATSAQKLAHEKRLADATPDEVVIPRESKQIDSPHEELLEDDSQPSPLDEESAPLFRHESFEPSGTEAELVNSNENMETIDEESATSSTLSNHESSQMLTPDADEDEELEEEDYTSELDNAPLFRHESNLSEQDDDEEEEGEFAQAPLLSHETGYSDYGSSNGFGEEPSEHGLDARDFGATGDYEGGEGHEELDDGEFESERTPVFPHEATASDEEEDEEEGDFEIPLLPHERDSLAPSVSNGSDFSNNNTAISGEPTFAYEEATPRPGLEDPRGYFFAQRIRTNSLPHTIPRSDEDDEDLNDPSLEAFPTNRDEILARVASISSSLPEDDVRELENVESPEFSVLSQACSSVSLVPKSGSLASVVEDEELEDIPDSGSHRDLPSPLLDMTARSRGLQAAPSSGRPSVPSPIRGLGMPAEQVSKPRATGSTGPMTSSSKDHDPEQNDARSIKNSEASAESVQKHDGPNDGSKKWDELYESIATPAKALQPLTPPLTPKKSATTKTVASNGLPETAKDMSTATSPLSKTSEDSELSMTEGDVDKSSSTDGADRKESFFRRLLSSCFGSAKQTSETVVVVGIAAAAYYYLYVLAGSGRTGS